MNRLLSRTDDAETAATGAAARVRAALPAVLSSLGAVTVALIVGALVIAVTGDDVVTAYRALFAGAFGGKRAIAETLVAATPLIFGGLAFAIAARAGMFNIGIEGQMLLGGLAAGLVAAHDANAPAVLHLPLAVLAAAVAGGIWGAIPGALKARFGAHEVITTIMLNYLAYRVSAIAIQADDALPVNPELQATNPAVPESRFPNILDETRLHAGLLLAVAVAIFLWYALFRTTFGYRIRTVGLSRGAAAYAGISWGRTITVAMLVSGLLAGLGGAGEALGLQGRYYNQAAGYGFTAIAVGLVGRNHPLGVVLAALLFGALSAGATRMQNTAGTSKEIVQVMQALVILSVAAFSAAGRFRFWRRLGGPFADRPVNQPGSGGDRASLDLGPDLEPSAEPPRV